MIHWASPAKLNLFLYITGRRPQDNYHNLQTIFQFLDYGDLLSFSLRDDNEINLLTPIANVPNEANLIIIAAKLLQSFAHQRGLDKGKRLGIDIRIDKKLPMGGGLGGASSNAATVLVALNHFWQLNLTKEQLMRLGRTIGADVPVFIYGHCAFAQGIGDILDEIKLPEKWFLVVQPKVEISTAKIFTHPDLIRNTAVKPLDELIFSPFTNDCEPLVRKLYPEIDQIIMQLSAFAPARLTGTGSCVFAEFDNKESALAVKKMLSQDMSAFVAKGINHSPILSALE